MIMMMYDCGLETKINLFIKNKISANNKKKTVINGLQKKSIKESITNFIFASSFFRKRTSKSK